MTSSGGTDFRLNLPELASHGRRTAVVARSGSLTYEALAERAASVKQSLEALGVAAGDPVALLSARRLLDEPVALAGILGANAVAVPLDASAPPKRLAEVLGARGISSIVADDAAAPLLDAAELELAVPLGRVVVDGDGKVANVSRSARPCRAETHASNTLLACILHTSGSTGTPKAVPVTWKGLDAFTSWLGGLIELDARDRVLRISELTFDLAWFDHIATWRAGGALVTTSRRDLAAGRAFYDALVALRPTVLYGTPSLFMKVTAASENALPSVTGRKASKK